jgi:hypothetical protein
MRQSSIFINPLEDLLPDFIAVIVLPGFPSLLAANHRPYPLKQPSPEKTSAHGFKPGALDTELIIKQ